MQESKFLMNTMPLPLTREAAFLRFFQKIAVFLPQLHIYGWVTKCGRLCDVPFYRIDKKFVKI